MRFEYKVLDIIMITQDKLEKKLNDLGSEGWELVSFWTGRFILKRVKL